MFLTVIVFIITLLILVLSHELGHFLMAKKFGVKVLEFGFGIPPRLLGKKIGETVYSINWLPIGGFVRLLGEDEVESGTLDSKKSFAYKVVWQRMLIVVAGVSVNLILAWLLFYLILIAQNFRIIYPTAQSIVAISEVELGSPAQQAGIKPGEQIVFLDGKDAQDIDQVIGYIRSKPNQPVVVTLKELESSAQRQVSITPKEFEPGKGRIGVTLSPVAFKEYKTFSEKLFSGIMYSFDLTKLNFIGLASLSSDVGRGNFTKASESVAGPVGMVKITSNILSVGGLNAVLPYLWFSAVLSLTLATINILPIPALDGGRLFFLLIEAVTRRKVKAELERAIHTFGMAILIVLVILVTYSDIHKLF